MTDLENSPNYITAKRAGLANDPKKGYDEYQSPWMAKTLGRLGVSGNRAGSGGGTTVYIEHLELPNVKEPEDFIREMNTFAQMTGVASGRG